MNLPAENRKKNLPDEILALDDFQRRFVQNTAKVTELITYLLSDEYRPLLRRAILQSCAIRASEEHTKALNLLDAAFPP